MKRIIVTVCSVLMLAFGNNALAAEPFEAEVEARQAFMKMVKFNLGILGDMAKGNREYDAKLAEALAKNIHAASQMDNGAMWPMGSDNSNSALSTNAKPEAWSEYPAVAEKHGAWIEASGALALNAGNGLSELRKNIGAVGKSCQGCHKLVKADD
ncbi:cytochrome c [Vibrio sp. ZSDZ34]|uniref:Cytochrome c n=1 Tax=Vibrio gelatinilyticus TaxID=2893468 RepID=A0A9X2AW37_9VIBR|nr:cytochrome c [Vibrio gelatinilyticus]MCJ2376990.1 cytochrome c [Vibrio gelatinilyticus]